MELEPGDYARIVGLKNDTWLNGKVCSIETDLQYVEVPEHDGIVRGAMRYGVRLYLDDGSGYIKPKNLEKIDSPLM